MKSKWLLLTIAVLCMVLTPVMSLAGGWTPKGSIKLQIGFGAGGSTDIMGRIVAAELEKQTGWNVVVENKPGGGGVAMLSTLMNQKPDGYVVGLCVNVPILINLVKRGDKLPFKIDSFDYIGTITRGENAMVAKADAPFNDIKSLIKYAKTKKVSVAFDAMPQQMVMTAVGKQAGVKFKFVKHKSGAEQIQSLLGGHVDVGCLAGAHIKYIESGDLKMITVFNKHRHSYSPDTTTIMDNGFNYYLDPYFYLAAPKGLPSEVKDALAKAFDNAIKSEKVKKAIHNSLKVYPHNLGPEATHDMLSNGVKDLKIVMDAGN